MNFDNIIDYLPGKKGLSNELYTKYDEVYSIWNLGKSLGLILMKGWENKEPDAVTSSICNFRYNYQLIKDCSKTLSAKHNSVENSISLLETGLCSSQMQAKDLIKCIHKLKEEVCHEIRTYSTHLANIFYFGYYLGEFHALLLHCADENEITESVGMLLTSIENIKKGDKKLESPNLEISKINLRILKHSFKQLEKNCNKLHTVAKNNYKQFSEFINDFIKMMTDIILDIKNPSQFIKNKLIFVVIYYYACVFIIIGAVQLITTDFYTSLKNFISPIIPSANEKLQFIILILLPLISVLTIGFRELKYLIIMGVIHFKVSKQIKSLLKDQENSKN